MNETAYAMWNPSFLHRTWDKRRMEAGLGKKKRHNPLVAKAYRERQAVPLGLRAEWAAMKLSEGELEALLAGFCEADGATIHASRGGQDDEGPTG